VHPRQPSDPQLRHATLDGRPITWVETDGEDKSAIVMVHGLPGSHRDFRWLAPPLEQLGLRVIRLDMPGFGGTATAPAQLSVLADHVRRRLDHLGLERVVLLGHSFGGPLALVAASREPDRVRGLALLSSFGLRPHMALRNVGNTLPMINRALGLPIVRRPVMRAVKAMFRQAGFPRGVPDHELRRSLEVVASVDFQVINEAVKRLRASTLIAFCDDDRLVEPAIGEQLGYACPSGPRLRFETGGHNPQKVWACEIAEVLEPWARACVRQLALPPATS
jgi:pimeloyl-ACP methyl ester carboxylesterase